MNKIKIEENKNIYEHDIINNYKRYYINNLNLMKQSIFIGNIHLINLTPPSINPPISTNNNNNNYILCEYDIRKKNESIKIVNSFEEAKRVSLWIKGINNEKEIKDNCEFFLNNNKINFCYHYLFSDIRKNQIKLKFKTPIIITNYMFYNCTSLISLNLSNFNANIVTNMSYMFYNCFSLISLNLSNINTYNVTNMSYMFYNCNSLISLNLSNFNTENINDMSYMFYNCNSLLSLDLSNFNTNNVTNMSYMFNNCSSLNSLNLSNFNTNNVEIMTNMFKNLKKSCNIIVPDQKLLNLLTNNTQQI